MRAVVAAWLTAIAFFFVDWALYGVGGYSAQLAFAPLLLAATGWAVYETLQ